MMLKYDCKVAGGFTRANSMTASIRKSLLDYSLSFVSSYTTRRMAASARDSQPIKSLLYLAAYFLRTGEGDSASVV